MVRFWKRFQEGHGRNRKTNSTMRPDMLTYFPLFCYTPPRPRNISSVSSLLKRNLEGKFDIIPRTANFFVWLSLECFSYIPSRSQPTMWQVWEARKGGGNLRAASGSSPRRRRARRGPSSSRPHSAPPVATGEKEERPTFKKAGA